MLFDGTDFVKSIKEKTQEIALQLSSNVDLTTHKFTQIFTFLITQGVPKTNGAGIYDGNLWLSK